MNVGDYSEGRRSPRRWLHILMLMSVFLSGGVVGSVVGAFLMRAHLVAIRSDPKGITEHVMPGIKSRVGLTDGQVESIEPDILRRHMAMQMVRAGSYALMRSNLRSMQQEVAAKLPLAKRSSWKSICDTIEDRLLPRGIPAPGGESLFAHFDANGDSLLKEDEVFPSMWFFLHGADDDRDGGIDRVEFERMKSMWNE